MVEIPDDKIARVVESLKKILAGFEGVEPGHVSAFALQLALEDISEMIGGEVGELARQIDATFHRLAHPAGDALPLDAWRAAKERDSGG